MISVASLTTNEVNKFRRNFFNILFPAAVAQSVRSAKAADQLKP